MGAKKIKCKWLFIQRKACWIRKRAF